MAHQEMLNSDWKQLFDELQKNEDSSLRSYIAAWRFEENMHGSGELIVDLDGSSPDDLVMWLSMISSSLYAILKSRSDTK